MNIRREKFVVQIRKQQRESIFKQKRNVNVKLEDSEVLQKFYQVQRAMLGEGVIQREKEMGSIKELISEVYQWIQTVFLREKHEKWVMDLAWIISSLVQDGSYHEWCRQYLVNSQTFELVYNQLYVLVDDDSSLLRLIEIEDSSYSENCQFALMHVIYLLTQKYDNFHKYMELEKLVDLYLVVLTKAQSVRIVSIVITTLNYISIDYAEFVLVLLKRDIVTKMYFAMAQCSASQPVYETFFSFIQLEPIPQIMDPYQFRNTVQIFAAVDLESQPDTFKSGLAFFAQAFKHIHSDQQAGQQRVLTFLESKVFYRVTAACIQSTSEDFIELCFLLLGTITNVQSDFLIKAMIDDNILIPIQYYLREHFKSHHVRHYLLVALANVLASDAKVKQKVFDVGLLSILATEFRKELLHLTHLRDLMYCIINALHESTPSQFQELFENDFYDCLVLYITSVDEENIDVALLLECYEVLTYIVRNYSTSKVNIKEIMREDNTLIQRSYHYFNALEESEKIDSFLRVVLE